MNPHEILASFTLRLIKHITDETGDIPYVSEEVLEKAVIEKLEDIADFIWEEFKKKDLK